MKKRNLCRDIFIIISLLLVYAFISKILDPVYAIKSISKIVLFVLLPFIISKVFLSDLEWFKINFSLKPVRKSCLLFTGIGAVIILVLFVFSKPLGAIFSAEQAIGEIRERTGATKLMIYLTFIYIPFFNSFTEEIFFRGFILGRLLKNLTYRHASIISALLFSLYHLTVFRNWFNLPVLILSLAGLFASGLILNHITYRFNSLLPVWIVHGLANIAIFAVALPFV